MSNNRFKELKNKLKKQQEEAKAREEGGGQKKFNSNIYPHWEAPVGQTVEVRFIPDANEENENIFWISNKSHKLSIEGKDRTFSCLKNYGEDCPVCDLSKAYYKAEGKTSAKGKYFYREEKAIARAVIMKDPLPAGENGETALGKTKELRLADQLQKVIVNELANTLTEDEDPCDFDNGFNFIINVTAQGEYKNYAVGSAFARRSSSIPKEYRDGIELVDLRTLRPPNPGLEKVQRMLDAHLSGGSFEDDKSKDKETPKTVENSTETTKPQEKVVEKVEEKIVESKNDTPADDVDEAENLLAQLRRNRAKKD